MTPAQGSMTDIEASPRRARPVRATPITLRTATRPPSRTASRSSTPWSSSGARSSSICPTPVACLRWLYDHELLHEETLAAESARFAADPVPGERALRRVHRVRAAIRELLVATVDGRPPGARELDEMNRALRFHYVTYLVPAPDGVIARPQARGRSGRGRDGPARRVGRAGAHPGPTGATAGVRERGVSLDLPRHLPLGQAEVVRHAHLRQPGEGRPAPAATT